MTMQKDVSGHLIHVLVKMTTMMMMMMEIMTAMITTVMMMIVVMMMEMGTVIMIAVMETEMETVMTAMIVMEMGTVMMDKQLVNVFPAVKEWRMGITNLAMVVMYMLPVPMKSCMTIVHVQMVLSGMITSGDCVSSCEGMEDGDYQSCEGCHVYATCSNEILHDNRPCPDGLVWDDNAKRCEWTSETCTDDGGPPPDERPPPPPGSGDCVSSCEGMEDGDYQSCEGCHVYATCSNEILHDNRPCPDGLVWDDNAKRCEWTSETCTDDGGPPPDERPPPPPGSGDCVSSCEGMEDGDYQSCEGCHVYATCSNEILHDNRPCPDGLVWDDNAKRCEWTSDTCPGEDDNNDDDDDGNNDSNDNNSNDDDSSDDDGNGNSDNDSSDGNGDGDSDDSNDSDGNGDSDDGQTTGECVSSCEGMEDGDYQSCNGCHVYVTCSNEIMHDNRPCPDGLVWDDNLKRCEWESSTCEDGGTAPPPATETAPPPVTETAPPPATETAPPPATETAPPPATETAPPPATETEPPPATETAPPPATETAPPPVDCVSSCEGMDDGDYQSCEGCHVYATCSNEILHDNRPCPDGLVWDDNAKRCEWTSETCTDERTTTPTEGTPTPTEGTPTPTEGTPTPTEGTPTPTPTEGTPTPTEGTPTTTEPPDHICNCVSDCTGLPNGDYPSCRGCHFYATCSNEILHDKRPCPDGLLWDDHKKRCEWESTTCR